MAQGDSDTVHPDVAPRDEDDTFDRTAQEAVRFVPARKRPEANVGLEHRVLQQILGVGGLRVILSAPP
jgi:hypothetical protein